MIILGINAYHGDAAAAIVRDSELMMAVEEKRRENFGLRNTTFTFAGLPSNLEPASVSELSEVEFLVVL